MFVASRVKGRVGSRNEEVGFRIVCVEILTKKKIRAPRAHAFPDNYISFALYTAKEILFDKKVIKCFYKYL